MSKKLYVGNLSYNTNEEALRSAFSEVGTVESAVVIMDKMTGRSKGFGFVELATEEEAQSALAKFDGAELDGRSLKVNEARPQEERPRRNFDNRRGYDN